MIKYKSVKTYNRVKEIQIENPVFDLSSKEDIDSRLFEFR